VVRFPALLDIRLERGPLSLVSTTDELFGRKCSGSGLQNREYGRKDPSRWPRDTLYPQKLALTSLTRCGRSVGIVRSWTKATELHYCSFSEAGKLWKLLLSMCVLMGDLQHSGSASFRWPVAVAESLKFLFRWGMWGGRSVMVSQSLGALDMSHYINVMWR
jgi:hypothetical protein